MLGNSYNVFRQAPVQSPGYANSINRTAYLIKKKIVKKNIFFCHCVRNKFIVLWTNENNFLLISIIVYYDVGYYSFDFIRLSII